MKAMRSSRSVRAMRMLWMMEMALLMLAVTGGVWLRFLGDNVGRDAYIQTAPLRSFVVALVMATAMAAFGLYQAHVRQNRIDFLLRLLLSFAFGRSEEHTSELQSLMRISYAVFCLKKKRKTQVIQKMIITTSTTQRKVSQHIYNTESNHLIHILY